MSTLRKALQRSRLAQTGGKRLDVHLSASEVEKLESYRIKQGCRTQADAVRRMVSHAGD
jgi:hypothetical protein